MPTDLAKVIFGQIYVGGFLSIANIFYTDTDTSIILLAIFVSIWANDTGAYLAGSTLGRHKLFPSVSPKKSWEGFVGGLIAAVVATGLLLGWEQCYIGVIISIAATWGDLFESMVKRSVGVKDSGNIIPRSWWYPRPHRQPPLHAALRGLLPLGTLYLSADPPRLIL